MRNSNRLRAEIAWLVAAFFASFTSMSTMPCSASAATRSPEEDTLLSAKHLKPISDEEWKQLAGERVAEKYTIAKGDTLSDISKRLFGDIKYWPKLWALNNESIANAHLIYPDNTVAFLPGSGSSLPGLEVQSGNPAPPKTPGVKFASEEHSVNASDAGKQSEIGRTARSDDWKRLPHQRWETFRTHLPPEVDPLGFDRRSVIRTRPNPSIELVEFASSEKLVPLGEITGSRSEASGLMMGDTVYIRGDEDLKIGEVYGVAGESQALHSRKSDRSGYAHAILGKVRVVGQREGTYIGEIVSNFGVLPRGSKLIPLPPRSKPSKPTPAEHQIRGTLVINRAFSTSTTAQHKFVFVDRGSEDGVKEGNVFRAYAYRDGFTGKKLTDSDFIGEADLLVLQVTPRFATCVIMSGVGTLIDSTPVVLLTDVADIQHVERSRLKKTGFDAPKSDVDELDQLDDGSDLGNDEKKELKQLENWQKNPEGEAKPADPAESPESVEPPPPPPESSDTSDIPPPPAESPETAPPEAPSADAPPPPAPDVVPGEPSSTSPDETKAIDGLLNAE